ncbi:MAG: hypothetical protein IT204_01105 [Fimbriimonadaceae bacterium]|nr:hypothetical protein [Fimbriimonadaceae bacterium]
MAGDATLLRALGGLLSYPEDDFPERLATAVAAAAATPVAATLVSFADEVGALTAHQREELFTRTFDLNPVCALDLGWHLFGEDYQRGLFLVKLRGLLAAHELPESTELPDHLTHVLPLLAALPDDAGAHFAASVVAPGLRLMLGGFNDESCPYRSLLLAVQTAVAECCPAEAEVNHA